MFFVMIAGHLGKDPETRFTSSGQKVTSFSVATKQRKGKEDVTIWVRVTVWGDRFDKFLSYLKKGSGVIVSGRMHPPTSYTDKEGRTQISLEMTAEMVEFSPFGRGDHPGEGQATQSSSQTAAYTAGYESSSYGGAAQPAANQFQVDSKSAPSYGSVPGQGNAYSQTFDEDNLPF